MATALPETMPETATSAATTPLNFDEAFTLHHRAVFRAAYAVVRDAGIAEDVTQEVFLKFYRHLDSLQNAEHVRPWLLRVALNESLNSLRGRQRAGAREEMFAQAVAHGGDGGTMAAVDAVYERRIEVEEARRALAQVKEPMRSCLLLKQQGLSYREIAETLSVKEINVGSLIARGRKEFIRVYGKLGGGRS